jgi:anti-sigma regulatory factor (Ser/Thr protein kinase)
MRKEFERHIDSLKEINIFVKSFIIEEQLSRELESPLNLVIEEIFTNMVKYNSGNPNRIQLALTHSEKKVTIEMIDYDVEPFNICQSKDYNTKQSLQERPVGKIGIHLVKKYVDNIDYEYQNRTSKITLTKYLGKKYV